MIRKNPKLPLRVFSCSFTENQLLCGLPRLLSIQPLANIIGDYTCENGKQEIKYSVINDVHLLPAGRFRG